MKRNKILWCVLILIMLFIVACSKGAEKETKKTTEKSMFSPAIFEDETMTYFLKNPIFDGEEIVLTMWVNEDWIESYEFLIQEYQKYRPNVHIELTAFPWKTYWAKLRIAMQNGTGPDIFHMHNSFLADFEPYLSPLPDEFFGREALKTSFGDAVVESDKVKQYCVNLGRSTGGIFYNKKMWRDAGLPEEDYPKTWEDLRAVANMLTQYNSANTITVDGFNFNEELPSLLMAMQAQKGRVIFGEDGYSHFKTADNIENIYYLRQLCHEDKVCRTNEAPAYNLFGNEKAAMIYGWSWVANDLEKNYPTLEYGFFRIPVWEENPPAYEYHNFETSFVISAQLKEEKRKIAEDLLLFYLCNDDVLIKAVRQAQIVPSKKSLITDDSSQLGEVIRTQAEYVERTAFKGVVPDAVYTYFNLMINADLMDESTRISEQLQKADDEITRILQTYDFQSELEKYKYYSEFSQ